MFFQTFIVLLFLLFSAAERLQPAVLVVQRNRTKFPVNPNVSEHDFRLVSTNCKEVLKQAYVRAADTMTDNPCRTSAAVFEYSDRVAAACKSTRSDNKFLKLWIKGIYEEVRECVYYSLPGCSIQEFYRSCWMGKIRGLHHLPPFVTDITNSDIRFFERKFKQFSKINRKNTCCLVERADACFKKFYTTQCENLEEQCFGLKKAAENYMDYLVKWVNSTYFTEIEKTLHCKKFFMPEEACASVNCSSCLTFSGFLLVLSFFVLLKFEF